MPSTTASRRGTSRKATENGDYHRQLRDQVCRRLSAKGISTDDRWKPKPKEKLNTVEQERLERQRRNKRNWARKERERSREEMESLKTINSELEMRKRNLKGKVDHLMALKDHLKHALHSHGCVRKRNASLCAKKMVSVDQQPWARMNRPITVEVGEDGILRRPSKKHATSRGLSVQPASNGDEEDEEVEASSKANSGFQRIKGTDLVIHRGQIYQLNLLAHEGPSSKPDPKESTRITASRPRSLPEDEQRQSTQGRAGNSTREADAAHHENIIQTSNSATENGEADLQTSSGGFSFSGMDDKSFLNLLQGDDDDDQFVVNASAPQMLQAMSASDEGRTETFTTVAMCEMNKESTEVPQGECHYAGGAVSFPTISACGTAVVTTQPAIKLENRDCLRDSIYSFLQSMIASQLESQQSSATPCIKMDDDELGAQQLGEFREVDTEPSSDLTIMSVTTGGRLGTTKTRPITFVDMSPEPGGHLKQRPELDTSDSMTSSIISSRSVPTFVNPWAVTSEAEDVACHVEITTDDIVMASLDGDATNQGQNDTAAARADSSRRRSGSSSVRVNAETESNFNIASNVSFVPISTTTNAVTPGSRASPGDVTFPASSTSSASRTEAAPEAAVKTETIGSDWNVTSSRNIHSHAHSSNHKASARQPAVTRQPVRSQADPTHHGTDSSKLEVDESLIADILLGQTKAERIRKRSVSESLDAGSDVGRPEYGTWSSSSSPDSPRLSSGMPSDPYSPATSGPFSPTSSSLTLKTGQSFGGRTDLRTDDANVRSF